MSQAGKSGSSSTATSTQTTTSPFMPQRPAGGARGR
jgi:hypothetical protein